MREGDEAFEALRAAIDDIAAAEVADLVAEARIEARAKVRSILAEAIAQALLERSGELLGEDGVAVEGAGAVGDAERRTSASPGRDSRPASKGRPGEAVETAVQPEALPPVDGSGARRVVEPMPDASPASEARAVPAAPAVADPMGAPTASEPPADPSTREDSKAEPATPVQTDGASGLYVYCVLSPGRHTPPGDQRGVGTAGESVREVTGDGISALVSPVSLAEFGEERLRENLNDVTWLEETARTHEEILASALATTTVIPMRLCTVYSSEDSVREMLERERGVFLDALARLDGRTEWGVKVFAERDTLERSAVERRDDLRALREEIDALGEGEAYMERRRLDALAGEEVDVLADACVDDVHARLAAGTVEALLNPLQRPEVTGRSGEMLLNGVYLVDDLEADAFHATVAGLSEDYSPLGFEIELTGPWPPYNFVGGSIEAAR